MSPSASHPCGSSAGNFAPLGSTHALPDINLCMQIAVTASTANPYYEPPPMRTKKGRAPRTLPPPTGGSAGNASIYTMMPFCLLMVIYISELVTIWVRAYTDDGLYTFTYETQSALAAGISQAVINCLCLISALCIQVHRTMIGSDDRATLAEQKNARLLTNGLTVASWIALLVADCITVNSSETSAAKNRSGIQLAINFCVYPALWLLWHQLGKFFWYHFIPFLFHVAFAVCLIVITGYSVHHTEHPDEIGYVQDVVEEVLLFEMLHLAAEIMFHEPEKKNEISGEKTLSAIIHPLATFGQCCPRFYTNT